MSDQMQTIRDDIAYLKNLAEEGREGSERGGVIGVAAGAIFAACSVVQWAALSGRVTATASNLAWIVGMLAFFAVLIAVKSRLGASTGRSRIAGVAWQGVGWAVFTLFFALAVASWRTQSLLLISFAPSIILALYGAAWTVAGVISGKSWVRLMAFGSFLGAVICAWFITDPVQYLVYAAGLILLAALPGAILMRQERKAGA
jgi:hypothetical protein